MIATLYIRTVNFLITHIPFTVSLRDMLTWPIASRVLGTEYSAPQALKAGFRLNAFMEDQLGRFALFYGPSVRYFWEPTTMCLLECLVKDAHDVIIAGSHIGLTALYARHAMKTPDSRVHTFEPIAHLFDVSKKNFDLNIELGEIVLTRAALGNESGTVTMTQDRIRSRIVSDASETNIETESVPVTTIDAYAKEYSITKLDLVLLDVEGYEYNALVGMREILTSQPPADIIYEISFPNKDALAAAHRIESFLSSYGYTCYIIEEAHDPILKRAATTKGRLLKTSSESYELHSRDRYFNVYATLRSDAEVSEFNN